MQVQFDAGKVVPRPEDKIKGGFSEFFFFFCKQTEVTGKYQDFFWK